MAAIADPQQKLAPGKTSDENVFSAWRSKKESSNLSVPQNAPAAGAGGRRKSNVKDLMVSNMKGVLGNRRMTISQRARSDVSVDQMKPMIRRENTYRMKPDSGEEFSVSKVTRVVKQLLEDELGDEEYDHDVSSKLACELTERIKDKVKELHFARYKIATNVFIGQVADQGMQIGSRCCWDESTDNYACITHKTKTLFVIALVYGIYFE